MSTWHSLESFEKNLYFSTERSPKSEYPVSLSLGGYLDCSLMQAMQCLLSEQESRIPPWFWLQVPPLVSLNDGLGPKSITWNQPFPPLSCFPSKRLELEQVGKEERGGQERAKGRAPSSKHRVRMNDTVKVECANMNNSCDLTIIV